MNVPSLCFYIYHVFANTVPQEKKNSSKKKNDVTSSAQQKKIFFFLNKANFMSRSPLKEKEKKNETKKVINQVHLAFYAYNPSFKGMFPIVFQTIHFSTCLPQKVIIKTFYGY